MPNFDPYLVQNFLLENYLSHEISKYPDVSLVPNYSEIYSRSDADPRVELFGNKYNLPIIPANMQSVINIDIAKWMSEHNYFYIMHRFGQNLFDLVVQANEEKIGKTYLLVSE